MKKNIWIMNHYATGMLISKGGRHYWFAKYLKQMGYEPIIFSSNTKHGEKDRFFDFKGRWKIELADDIQVPFVLINTKLYGDNGKERIINMVDFYRMVKKVAVEYAEKYGKPDIIYASSVHPLTLVAGIELAKKYNVKCICEVRDLWPEAILAYSKKIKKNSIVARLLYRGEKWIYTKADVLIFTQEGGLDYIRSHRWDVEQGGSIDMNKAYHINNGVDLEAFDRNLKEFWLDDEDLDNKNIYKVIYAGAIRRINNLGLILDAAKLITNPKVRFIIFGDGDELESLKKRLVDENIQNVVFKGKVNKQYIPSVDSRADLNIVHWEMNELVKRVGESYNKAFEYFAAGKPVFYTIRPGYSIVEKYHCGRLTEGFTSQDIAEGIENMANLHETDRKEMAKNARKVAEIYDFKNLTKKLIDIIEKI